MTKIITIPHLTLRQVSQPITRPDRHLRRLLTDLQTTLTTTNIGLGLAAPQIGSNQRVFALYLPHPHTKTPTYQYFINPTITRHSDTLTPDSLNSQTNNLEGCLSVPHVFAPIPRYTWLDITYQTLQDGQLIDHQDTLTDFTARVFQHELDHLDGILFIDHALRQRTPLYLEDKQGQLQSISQADFYKIFGKNF